MKNRWPRTKQEPIDQFRHCLSCPPKPQSLPIDTILGVGFGEVVVTKDKEVIWCGDSEKVRLSRFEKRACKKPRYDWRVKFIAPLYEATYQRHRKGKWVLIEKGIGFA